MRSSRVSASGQRGMVLVVSLVLLIAMTLLGLAAMQNTSLEERMAGNVRAEHVAFQASEAALRAGELWMMLDGTNPRVAQPAATASAPGANQVWRIDGPDPNTGTDQPWWSESTGAWWTTAGNSIAYAGTLTNVGGQPPAPRYLIEEESFVRDTLVVGQQQDYGGRWFYQVTSRGTDAGGRGEALLRSSFARRF